MVASSDEAVAAGAAGGKKKGGKGGGKGAAKEGGKKALSVVAINRRIAVIQKLEDADKAKKARARLIRTVLNAIADGSVRQPSKAAQAVVAIMPKKAATAEGADD